MKAPADPVIAWQRLISLTRAWTRYYWTFGDQLKKPANTRVAAAAEDSILALIQGGKEIAKLLHATRG